MFSGSPLGEEIESVMAGAEGKYVKVGVSDAQFSQVLDQIDDLREASLPTGPCTKGDAVTEAGLPAIVLLCQESRLVVATDGEPHPLRHTKEDGSELVFSDFDAVPEIEAPPADEVFDLATVTN
jgi:hypothetical protein